MNNDAVQRLREPAAWVLLGSVGLQLISGLIDLVLSDGLPFTYRAYSYVRGDQFFTGVVIVGLVVLAVLLATRLGGAPTRQARTVAMAGLILLGAVGLLLIICVLAGLASGRTSSGILLDAALTGKVSMFLYGAAKLAVVAVGGYYVFGVYQSLGPARPPVSQPYAQGAYGPQAQPYGPPYGPPVQPPYGPPSQQAYPPQGYGAPSAYYQQQPPSAQAQPPVPPPAPAPPTSVPPPAPAPPTSVPPTSVEATSRTQPASDTDESEWTRGYGTGDQPRYDSPEGSGSVDAPPSSDPYRPPE